MSALRTLSGGIRFVTYLPWFVLTFYAYPVFKSVRGSPELYHPPYNTNIPLAAGCAGVAAIMGVVWTFLTWIPSFAARGVGAFAIGFVDATITVLLFIQVIVGATFIPMDGCKNHDMSTYGAPNGHRSIFLVVANQTVVNATVGVGDRSNWLNGAKQASYDSCKDFLTTWGICVVLMVLFFVATICNVILTFHTDYSYPNHFPRCLSGVDAFLRWLIKWPWRHSYPRNTLGAMLTILLVDVPLFGPTILVAVLPSDIHRWLWTVIRCTGKLSLTLWQSVVWGAGDMKKTRKSPQPEWTEKNRMLELKVLPKHRRAKRPSPLPAEISLQPQTTEQRFADFLILDILMLISWDLHFQDLINLSLTSRNMRQIIFPAGSEAKKRWELYRLYTCAPASRQRCDGCATQVCTEIGCGMQVYMSALDSGGNAPLMKHCGKAYGPCLPYCLSCWNKTANNNLLSRERCLCMFNSTMLLMCAVCSSKRGRALIDAMRCREEEKLRKEKFNGVECGKCRKVSRASGLVLEKKKADQAGDAA